MKKIFSYLGWILFAVTLITMFYIAKPSKTVDFSGVVKSIEYNEQENCTYITASMIHDDNSSVIIKAKDNISVKIEPLEICAKKDSKTECKVYIKPNIIAPIEEGELLGRAEYFVDGNKVAQKEIKADKNIPQSKIKKWDIYLNIFEFMILHI